MNPTKTEAIKRFLIAKSHLDLAEMYTPDMECQVLVAKDNGDEIEGEYKGRIWKGYQNLSTGETWKSFRIPFNAKINAEYIDSEIKFNLDKHVEGIGLTGWDWKNRLSHWVAFDFDAITNHTKGLTPDQLNEIKESLMQVPWSTIRRSTSGAGLHIYVPITPTHTDNHDEHAALARAILGQLSGLVGIDFQSKVDTCGGNMWVWHRKMVGTEGLKLLKQGCRLDRIPENWKDHLVVVKGAKRKLRPSFAGNEEQTDLFEQMTSSRPIIPLDEEHRKLISYAEAKGSSWWNQDHHMLITHTFLLKEAHEELGLKGIFQTNSTGKDRGNDWNCFLYPLRHGAWVVRRFGQGVAEAHTWDQDQTGWTRCYYNKEPDLASACRTFAGKEHPAGGYVFSKAEDAARAAEALGINMIIPQACGLRKVRLKQHPKDGRLIAEMKSESGDEQAEQLKDWILEKQTWKKIFNGKITSAIELETDNLDDTIRHLITSGSRDAGWVIKSDNTWRYEPLSHVKPTLASMGLKHADIEIAIGGGVVKPWKLVNKPFEKEEPGDREWNKNAPQLKFTPISDEIPTYPHWKKLLQHCGTGLDDAVKENPWAKANGILTGSDYLMCWIASLFQEPFEPLPYLFFYGSQNSGKSTFHEALGLLITNGYIRADNALSSQGNFNGELQNALICVVEETDLKQNKNAYNKIKDWVTSKLLPIHQKGGTPFTIENTTKWIQCNNSHLACPIFPGDTRITMIRVPDLDPIEMIPRKQFVPLLEKEAPHFLAAALSLEIPSSGDRLNVPIIVTEEKLSTEQANQSMLDMFLKERTYHVTGELILYSEVFNAFQEWLDPGQKTFWTKQRFGRELPPYHPKGKTRSSPHYHIGNISFSPYESGTPKKPKLVLKNGVIVQEE